MEELEKIIAEARSATDGAATIADLEQAKARFLGKSGTLTALLKGLGKLSAHEKPKAGAAIKAAKERPGARVSQRPRRHPLADVPSGRGALDRRGHRPRGPEEHGDRFLPRVLRARGDRYPLPPVVLPVRRAGSRDRHGMVEERADGSQR